VPAVLLFNPPIPTFREPTRRWLLLAMASTFAGNLAIPGSVANLIVVEQARAGGVEVGVLEHLKVGAPSKAARIHGVVQWPAPASVPGAGCLGRRSAIS